ncbi:MAG: phosphatidylserine decarboxylase [Gammaproteobacteria bacterium]|nr:phosphatidylserine decarboxylase [Gammaproteobacteria bacterium]
MSSDSPPTLAEKFSGALQYIYPKRALSALMFAACRIRFEPWKNWQIRWFIRRYGIDMNEALEPDPLAYREFNTFFIRPLRPEVRPIDGRADTVAAPADGHILEFGDIHDGQFLQVKGHHLSVELLLGGPSQWSAPFINGQFVTVYLSPRDYHRVHMPLGGELKAMAYIPGELFSVSVACTKTISGLFTRNERAVSFFDTAIGPMAVVLVGAVFVGSIETLWAGMVHGRRDEVSWWQYSSGHAITIAKGLEMGRFNMGSTAIAVFPEDTIEWSTHLRPGQAVRMGETLGCFCKPWC